ncbi:MAG: hypothetical protein ABSG36_07340 [Acidimicrobiales bacterium]|jgi:hypothetical protein
MRRTHRSTEEQVTDPTGHDETDRTGAFTTRRAVIAGAAAGLAGLVADSVISAEPASASNGDAVLLGYYNSANSTTMINTTNGTAVSGISQEEGTGVEGASDTGVGVLAVSGSGTALRVEGVARFSRSGSAVVAGAAGAAKTSVTVTGVDLSDSSLILATPQDYLAGVSVAAVVPDVSAGAFTIYLTRPVDAQLTIAWFILG